ncbi:unnamed protein product [Gongylonema pulchrum]|uniref:Uncharacterized protein n=1 Tax=Gongylonema pulchrum TaxID=637853 RepID=A0A183DWJ1_9BILA|nr:unnamed protein product [Gongylonema pulchrum]
MQPPANPECNCSMVFTPSCSLIVSIIAEEDAEATAVVTRRRTGSSPPSSSINTNALCDPEKIPQHITQSMNSCATAHEFVTVFFSINFSLELLQEASRRHQKSFTRDMNL